MAMEEIDSAFTVGLSYRDFGSKLILAKGKYDRLTREATKYVESHPSAGYMRKAMHAYLVLHDLWTEDLKGHGIVGPALARAAELYSQVNEVLEQGREGEGGIFAVRRDAKRALIEIANAELQQARKAWK